MLVGLSVHRISGIMAKAGRMTELVRQTRGSVLCCAFLLATAPLLASLSSHAAVPNIPPAVLSQLQNLSPAEQAALARQYGFELPTAVQTDAMESTLGLPGEQLTLNEGVRDRLLQEEIERQVAKRTKMEDAPLKRFGLELFDREVSTFAPVDDMPPPDGYRVGPGDHISVFMYGNEEADLALAVNREGQLVLPRLGPLSVAGLTFKETKDLISAKVSAQLVGTEVVVSMGKLRSINVFLAGDVRAPGSYSVSGLSTVLQVLYVGGGITDIGSLRNIQVKRQGNVVAKLDAYDILLRGDTSGDVRLASGDSVFVPTVERLVTVVGEVKRPAIYEVTSNDQLKDLLQMAGGLTAFGYARSVSLERLAADRSSRLRVQADLTSAADLAMRLADGDKLSVAAVKDEISNQVVLRGAVARPGGYEWREGQKVSDLLSSINDDLLAETDLSTGLIVRRTGLGLEVEVLAFDLGKAIADQGGNSDLALKARDEVLIFSLPYLTETYKTLTEKNEEGANIVDVEDEVGRKETESEYEDRVTLIRDLVFRLEAQAEAPATTEVVQIFGDVRLPGKYPLLADRSLDTLITLAGGFENSAFLDSAEVTRLNISAEGVALAASFKVPWQQSRRIESFQLQAMDQIRINRIPNWSYGDEVTLTGSISFPGSYPIRPGEMLSGVLARAGGIAENGFVRGAVLIKSQAKEREQAQLQNLIASIQRSELSRSQTLEQSTTTAAGNSEGNIEILQEALLQGVGGRVVIDLPRILAGDSNADVQLEAGDSLFVPEFSNTLSIVGEVRQPGSFQFQDGRSVADYLDLAAGVTVRADKRETYVVRADGSVDRIATKRPLLSFNFARDGALQPGDTIVVPVNEEYQPVLARYREVSTVVFQSVASLYPLFRL